MNETIEPHELEEIEQKLSVTESEHPEADTGLEEGQALGLVVPSLSGFATP